MRKICLIIVSIFCFSTFLLNAQDETSYFEEDSYVPKVIIFGGSGLYNYTGLLGAGIELPIQPKFSIFGVTGVGGWGYKFGFGGQIYTKQAPYKGHFSFGYSLATGLNDFEVVLTTTANPDGEEVTLDLKPAGSVNLAYGYAFQVGNKGRIALSVGYAIGVTSNYYTVKSNHVLDETAELVLQWMKPSGLLLGVTFGLGI